MGLDISHNCGGMRYGNYGYVHLVRAYVVTLAAEYFLQKGLPAVADSLVDWRSKEKNTCPINYDVIVPLIDLQGKDAAVARGVHLLVDHSDCDGEHTDEEVTDIAEAFEILEEANIEKDAMNAFTAWHRQYSGEVDHLSAVVTGCHEKFKQLGAFFIEAATNESPIKYH